MDPDALAPAVRERLDACATPDGIIAAAAMDQRGSLKRALDAAGAPDTGADTLAAFKTELIEALSPHASAVLIDPRYGLEASRRRAESCGLLFAYERSGYDSSEPGRHGDLLEGWSVRRLADAGADGVKLLVYYNPDDPDETNERKHAFVERVGAECEAEGLPLFLEPVTYDDREDDPLELARHKPRRVRTLVEEFSRPRYRVSVLKIEFPVEAKFTAGLERAPEAEAYDVDEAREHLRAASDVARVPFIYLSAGVDMAVFTEMLELAADAGARYAGVLCGRATWKGGIAAWAEGGRDGLRAWLADEGVANIRRLNEVVARCAVPWRDAARG